MKRCQRFCQLSLSKSPKKSLGKDRVLRTCESKDSLDICIVCQFTFWPRRTFRNVALGLSTYEMYQDPVGKSPGIANPRGPSTE